MAKNWSDSLLQWVVPPETVDEAVVRLMTVLEERDKTEIRAMTEDGLIDLHFSLGMTIRNAFCLYGAGSKLLASCGVAAHPDDGSSLIVLALWRKLNQE
ncbi:MAG: hypothetical protein Q7U57_07980 [Methylovulum sp.]|nr:hypothetical protein [Methylovulum sp.]